MACCQTRSPVAPAAPTSGSACVSSPTAPQAVPVLEPGETGFILNIPAFSYEIDAWPGASVEVVQFNFEAEEEFTVVRLPVPPASVTYVACIRWRVGTTVHRYKLWEGVGEKLYFPVMPTDGSVTVPEFFVIEIWTVSGSLNPANAGGIPFLVSSDSIECVSRTLCDDIWFELPLDLPSDLPACVPWEDAA